MAYSPPPIYHHGDTVEQADLRILTDNLDFIRDGLEPGIFFPAAHVVSGMDNDQHYFVHRHRWLWFQSDGDLVDPANPTVNTISLNEDTEPTLFDLSSVAWLFPGKLYYVETCTWAMETPLP